MYIIQYILTYRNISEALFDQMNDIVWHKYEKYIL